MSSTSDKINITPAHLLRHMPKGAATQGREAALVDIAQDLLLRHLHQVGSLDLLAFKGGTSLRKLYAGNQGRFSLDLDFAVRDLGIRAATVLALLTEEVNGLTIGPFTYGTREQRGKHYLLMSSELLQSDGSLESKLDVSPPPWLAPIGRGWVAMPIHDRYGPPALPTLPVVRLEENLAEKIARLNRVTAARDMYDLQWVARTLLRTQLDQDLIRRLAVLKIWVDAFGVVATDGTEWRPAHASHPFDPEVWLRRRPATEYDDEDIGTLAVPAPKPQDLSRDVSAQYSFLRALDDDEKQVARLHQGDRPLVLRMLAALPDGRLTGRGLH